MLWRCRVVAVRVVTIGYQLSEAADALWNCSGKAMPCITRCGGLVGGWLALLLEGMDRGCEDLLAAGQSEPGA